MIAVSFHQYNAKKYYADAGPGMLAKKFITTPQTVVLSYQFISANFLKYSNY
jgi:hypothetical protein